MRVLTKVETFEGRRKVNAEFTDMDTSLIHEALTKMVRDVSNTEESRIVKARELLGQIKELHKQFNPS